MKRAAIDYRNELLDSGFDYFYGEGADLDAQMAISLSNFDPEVREFFKPFIKEMSDSFGTKTQVGLITSAAEQASIKNYIDRDTYTEDWKPSADDLVDYSKVASSGPDVYYFSVENDLQCPNSGADKLKSEIKNFKKEVTYGCGVGHEWFISRSFAHDRWMNDMISVLSKGESEPEPTGELITDLLDLLDRVISGNASYLTVGMLTSLTVVSALF